LGEALYEGSGWVEAKGSACAEDENEEAELTNKDAAMELALKSYFSLEDVPR